MSQFSRGGLRTLIAHAATYRNWQGSAVLVVDVSTAGTVKELQVEKKVAAQSNALLRQV